MISIRRIEVPALGLLIVASHNRSAELLRARLQRIADSRGLGKFNPQLLLLNGWGVTWVAWLAPSLKPYPVVGVFMGPRQGYQIIRGNGEFPRNSFVAEKDLVMKPIASVASGGKVIPLRVAAVGAR